MIAVEVIIAILVAAVVITGLMKVAGPIADAFSDRLKLKFQELGPEQERQFRQRIEALEEQVRELQSQMTNLQEATKFDLNVGKEMQTAEKINLKKTDNF